MRRTQRKVQGARRAARPPQGVEARRARMMYRMLDLGFTITAANRLLFGPKGNPQGSAQ